MNFYNDNDPKICAWLRELIKQKLIPDGVVDSRPIELIQPDELKPYIQCHFFAGIGGWTEALRLAGWPVDAPVWTGSCPCQPFSCAGKGKGADDARHLWPEFRRLIAACQPPVVFGEQVASNAGREWLAGVRADLETLAYEVGAADLCAASVGAPHIRQRLYWVGHANGSEINTTIHGQFLPGSGCDSSGGDGEAVRGVGEMETCGLAESTNKRHRSIGNSATGSGESERGCGLGDSYNAGCSTRKPFGEPKTARPECSLQPSASFRLGDTNPARPQGRNSAELRECSGEQTPGERSAWSDSEWLQCRDGKSRRTQSGVCPLAHGVPARVVRLRGYGNAIVPQVAAEFIGAYMDITPLPL